MAQFTVNTQRIDPYKNFKFRVKWQSEPGGTFAVVAGVSKVGALKRTTEVVNHREGGDISTERLSPGVRSLTRSRWNAASPSIRSSKNGQIWFTAPRVMARCRLRTSAKTSWSNFSIYRAQLSSDTVCSVAGCPSSPRFRSWMRTPMRSPLSTSCFRTKATSATNPSSRLPRPSC